MSALDGYFDGTVSVSVPYRPRNRNVSKTYRIRIKAVSHSENAKIKVRLRLRHGTMWVTVAVRYSAGTDGHTLKNGVRHVTLR